MSSRTWTNVAGAVIGGVLAYFTFGVSAIFMGAAVGYSVAGAIQGPEAPKGGAMRPDELQVVQSSESSTIPVGFGTFRLAGNIIGYDKASFKATEIESESEGGKGGGGEKQVTGYSYSMTWAVGLCMGPVDVIVQVQGSPGMDFIDFHILELSEKEEMVAAKSQGTITRDQFQAWLSKFYDAQEAEPTVPIDVTDGASLTLSFKGTKEDSGKVIFDAGTRTQVGTMPIDGEIYNYRDVCVATFVDYTMGSSPAPRTYLFTITRMPKVLDAEGVAIPFFPVNAAVDPEHPEFGDANPAAIIWEIFTNEIWGKGMSPDILNEDDFKKAAQYFQTNRIGISTTLGDDQSNVELVQRFRDLFGLVTWWDGEQVRARALWDRSNAYDPRIRITSEDMIGDPTFTRQSMIAATNEVRVTFSNRENNWQEEAATAQDLASIEEIGGIRSLKIDASEVGTRRCAELIAHRMLRTLAYPLAYCQLVVRRNFAGLQPGDFVEMVIDGWRGDALTLFWRVDTVDDDATGEDQIKVGLIEDVYATGRDGEIVDFDAPIPSIDFDDPLENDGLVKVDYSIRIPVGELTPVLVDEPNIWVSKNQRRLLVAVQRRSGILQSVGVGFREVAVGNFINAGAFQSFAFTGQTLDAIAADGPKIIRLTGDQFRLSLNHLPDALGLLSSASACQTDADGLDILTGTNSAIMVIGTEIFRCGFIEEATPGVFTLRVGIRAEYGSDKAAHAAGSTFHFFPVFSRLRMTMDAPALPIGLPTDIALNPYSLNGFDEPTLTTGPDAGKFSGRSIKPLRPELVSATRVGLVWTIVLRPRIYNGGANYGPNFSAELAARESDPGLHRLRLQKTTTALVSLSDYFASGSTGSAAMSVTSFVWTPPDGTDPAKGVWTLTVAFDTNPANLTVFGLLGGQVSDPLTIPQPL